MRVVIADDAALVRDGLALLLAEHQVESSGKGLRRPDAHRERRSVPPRRCARRHPHATHLHRRRTPRRTGNPRTTSAHRSARSFPAPGVQLRPATDPGQPHARRLPTRRTRRARRPPPRRAEPRHIRRMRHRPNNRQRTPRPLQNRRPLQRADLTRARDPDTDRRRALQPGHLPKRCGSARKPSRPTSAASSANWTSPPPAKTTAACSRYSPTYATETPTSRPVDSSGRCASPVTAQRGTRHIAASRPTEREGA